MFTDISGVIEPEDIYYLEAAGDETVVRRRGRRTLRDVRSLGEVMSVLGKSGLYRIHRGWAVNPRRIREIRLQHDGRDWEVVMLPPVNALPTLRTVEMIRFSFTGWADVDELEAHIAKLHTLND